MPRTPQQLVDDFHAGNTTFWDATRSHPETAWAAIVQLSREPLTDLQRATLAAGPLEDLLNYHGEAFIDRIEKEARVYRTFRWLLAGVWPSSIPEPIWTRVQYLLGPVR